MRRSNLHRLFKHLFKPKNAEQNTARQSHFTVNPEDNTFKRLGISDQLHAIAGLWEELSAATLIGRPKCLSQFNAIAEGSGIIDMQNKRRDDGCTENKLFTICSKHRLATQRLGLVPEESRSLATTIWALEGRSFKREASWKSNEDPKHL